MMTIDPTHPHPAPTAAPSTPTVLVGADRTGRTVVGLATVAWLAASAALGWSSRALLLDAPGLQDEYASAADWRDALLRLAPTPFAAVLVLGALVLIGVAVLQRCGRPRARLELAGRTLTLRHRLGTARRRVVDVDLVSVGDLVARESTHGDGTIELSVGTYLRLGRRADARRAVTVGCLTPNDLHQRWGGFTPDHHRRRWDLTLGPDDFARLQDALAAQGLLVADDRPHAHATYVIAPWTASDLLVFGIFGAGALMSLFFTFVR